MPTNLLPKKVTLKFRGHKGITTIEGFMGMFSLSNLSDFRKQTNSMILKVMDNKYYYPGKKNEAPFFFDGLKNVKVSITNETKVLAGFKCRKALTSYTSGSHVSFDVYYTDELKIKNTNKSGPFADLDGVLMQFNINISNIEMQLTASKYKPDAVPKDIFEIPQEYKKVSRDKLVGVLAKLLE